ncbi:hypothetical protein NRB56_70860 [Nocardia sp. RB56]|uniref:Uncharacterized protein n=1 Tax=Nocardia aurantia TaxID=2585199 RepID=A0A7K0E120_9NOCA|nr:hypothetical protein [Nocardia aurantia]
MGALRRPVAWADASATRWRITGTSSRCARRHRRKAWVGAREVVGRNGSRSGAVLRRHGVARRRRCSGGSRWWQVGVRARERLGRNRTGAGPIPGRYRAAGRGRHHSRAARRRRITRIRAGIRPGWHWAALRRRWHRAALRRRWHHSRCAGGRITHVAAGKMLGRNGSRPLRARWDRTGDRRRELTGVARIGTGRVLRGRSAVGTWRTGTAGTGRHRAGRRSVGPWDRRGTRVGRERWWSGRATGQLVRAGEGRLARRRHGGIRVRTIASGRVDRRLGFRSGSTVCHRFRRDRVVRFRCTVVHRIGRKFRIHRAGSVFHPAGYGWVVRSGCTVVHCFRRDRVVRFRCTMFHRIGGKLRIHRAGSVFHPAGYGWVARSGCTVVHCFRRDRVVRFRCTMFHRIGRKLRIHGTGSVFHAG